ncbi:MAG: pyridoxal phosphate-dependent aminotransferase [Thermoplasmatota archaeon]
MASVTGGKASKVSPAARAASLPLKSNWTPLFADRMINVDMSGIRKMFELATPNAINFGIGEPDFQPPRFIIDAFYQAMLDGHNKYGPTAGIPELRQALADKERERWPEITPASVVITPGSTSALYACMVAFVNPGEEVLIPDPGFVLYAPHVRLANARPVFYPLHESNGFVPKVEDIEPLITDRTKAIIVNSPSNPTGSTIPERDVRALAELAERHELLVISDEAYDSITYDDPHTSFLGQYDNVIYINSFSKAYALTGWRIGYTIARPEIADAIKKVSYHLVACPPTPTQYACLAAVRGPQDFTKEMAASFKERRDLIVKLLRDVPGFNIVPPKGAFYAFPSYDLPLKPAELCMKLLEAGVVVTPGDAFGPSGAGHIRFSYATSQDNLRKGLAIVRDTVAKLRTA